MRRKFCLRTIIEFLTTFVLITNCAEQLPPAFTGPKREVTVQPGMSLPAIAESLKQKQIINSTLLFRFLVWLNNYENQIKPGRYRFAPNSDPRLVLKTLIREIPAHLMVTIPEGTTTQQIARLLEENGICPAASFLAACTDTILLRSLDIPFRTVEGYLFPETYEFQTGSNPETIIRRLVHQCRLVLTNLKKENKTALSEPQAIILASIIEKEAKVPDEFPIIAGVFLNRLRRNIPLQSCATIEFLLPKHKERLSLEDLKIPSPYNTYLHHGLPPGPICNPGRLALRAALFPARHSYLYFVSRGDGTHIFSTNSREHESAVRDINR
ncbi:MAG: endolytic transglycosylase MltG [bacterium]